MLRALPLLALLGCPASDPVQTDRAVLTARSELGHAQVTFDGEATAMRLALRASEGSVRVERLIGPTGVVFDATDWLGSERLTFAVFDGPGDVVFGWPIRHEDIELSAGEWSVDLTVSDADGLPLDGVELLGAVERKHDDDLRRGTLRAAVLVPRSLSPDLTDELDRGLDAWSATLARANVRLEIVMIDADLPAIAPDPRLGDPALRAAADLAPDAEILVWLAEDFAVDASGLAGAIPSAPRDTLRPALVVALGHLAGADGVLDRADARGLGHALAHETGHYLGLFHPVEPSWDAWDALTDTPACGAREACEAAMGDLVMFPYEVCAGECLPAHRWTLEQRHVLQRYVGVQ